MADVNLKTKIKLKTLPLTSTTGDSWEKQATYVPLKGEVCIAEIPSGSSEATTAPTVLFKVGDGTNDFRTLKWASALAGDVYDWAKKTPEDFIKWFGTKIVVNSDECEKGPIVSIAHDASSNTILAKTGKIPSSAISDLKVGVTSIAAGNGILVTDDTSASPTIAIKTGGTDASHNVALSTTSGSLQANVDLSAYLKSADYKNTTYYLEYDKIEQKIFLKEGNGDNFIVAKDFIKDGMIQSGVITTNDAGTKVLRLTFNSDGPTDPVDIPVSDLVDTYTAAKSAAQVQLAISDSNEISATLVNGGVSTDKLANSAVTEAKIANGAVTSAKLAAAVTESIVEAKSAGTNAQTTANEAKTAAANAQAAANKAVTTTTQGKGLKIINQTIDIDTDVTFILDCN